MTILKQLSNTTNLFPRNSFQRENNFNFGLPVPVHGTGYVCSCDLGFQHRGQEQCIHSGAMTNVQKYQLWIQARLGCKRPTPLLRHWLTLLQCSVVSTAYEGFLKGHLCPLLSLMCANYHTDQLCEGCSVLY